MFVLAKPTVYEGTLLKSLGVQKDHGACFWECALQVILDTV